MRLTMHLCNHARGSPIHCTHVPLHPRTMHSHTQHVTRNTQHATRNTQHAHAHLQVQAPDLDDDWVLFTIHTYAESLKNVTYRSPRASIVLARALRALDERQQRYRGVLGHVDHYASFLEDAVGDTVGHRPKQE